MYAKGRLPEFIEQLEICLLGFVCRPMHEENLRENDFRSILSNIKILCPSNHQRCSRIEV
jgi:hypothetical protein